MRLKSYAQNFEDVILWRALKHIDNGFYVDLGAQHPIIDSVSLAFYEHGWRGVHVEPNAYYAQLLRESRIDETVIHAAVSNKKTAIKFYEIPDTGLSTCDLKIAEVHRASGFFVNETSIHTITLDSIFKLCAGREIHWLKVDVEGFESQVLQSWKPSMARPWIVVIESTEPSTQFESYESWESLLLELDYQFVYFDGLNRFYLSKKHPELIDSFRVGPNIFDEFVLSGTASSSFCLSLNSELVMREKELGAQILRGQAELTKKSESLRLIEKELAACYDRSNWLEKELSAGQVKIDDLSRNSHHLWNVANELNRELQAVYASRSWRLSEPFRKTSLLLKQAKNVVTAAAIMVLNEPNHFARAVLRNTVSFSYRHPKIKAIAVKHLAHFPVMKARIRAFVQNNSIISSPNFIDKSLADSALGIQSDNPAKQVELPILRSDLEINLQNAVNNWPLGKRINE